MAKTLTLVIPVICAVTFGFAMFWLWLDQHCHLSNPSDLAVIWSAPSPLGSQCFGSDTFSTITFVFAVWFEPTDVDKAIKPFLSESWKALTYTSPNLVELCAINQALGLPTPDGAILAILEAATEQHQFLLEQLLTTRFFSRATSAVP